MAKTEILNMAGTSAGETDLKDEVFATEPNVALMHQIVVAEEANSRQGTHDTKNRALITGGGRKPFRQKGTGRARQGTIRAPHMYHGAVVFGPHPRSYEQCSPKKMRHGAARSAFSARFSDGDIIVVDEIRLDAISTKSFAAFLKAVGAEGKVLVITAENNDVVWKSARNIPGICMRVAPQMSTRDILVADKIIIENGAVATLEEVLLK